VTSDNVPEQYRQIVEGQVEKCWRASLSWRRNGHFPQADLWLAKHDVCICLLNEFDKNDKKVGPKRKSYSTPSYHDVGEFDRDAHTTTGGGEE